MNYAHEKSDIGELVRKLETDFISGGGTQTSKYVNTDFYEDISTIYAYLGSKHISGLTDSLGREKPFSNIVIGARNIWYRATDLDRKTIKIRSTKLQTVVKADLANIILQDWMKREEFGLFLNKWGMELAGFCDVAVKIVETGSDIHIIVTPWSRLIADQIDFDNNPKIEILELTEGQLRMNPNYNQDMVDNLCSAKANREITDGTDKDNKGDYIKLYEIHGNLPLSYLTGKEEDKKEYVQQMHVLSFIVGKGDGEFDDYTLYSGREEEDPYILTSLMPEADGTVGLNGSVKRLFDNQWMENHTVKITKDQLDLANKLIFQTSDANYVNQNLLTDVDTGHILIHTVNQPLTQLNNTSHDTVSIANFRNQWKSLGNEINGISEAMLGANPPSGSAWRQTEALLSESHSLFEVMTENKGLYLEKILRRVIKHIKSKKLNNSKEISAILEANDLRSIDSRFIKNKSIKIVNNELKKMFLSGKTPTPEMQAMMTEQVQGRLKDGLAELGNQRFFKPSELDDKTWKEVLEDLEWDIEIDITGEARDMQSVMTTLNTALQVLMNPNFANNPKAQLVIDKILMATSVISPAELSSLPSPVATPMVGQVETPASTESLTK